MLLYVILLLAFAVEDDREVEVGMAISLNKDGFSLSNVYLVLKAKVVQANYYKDVFSPVTTSRT